MRNRANTPVRDEQSFISGGSANTTTTSPALKKSALTKAKPVSISLSAENLKAIDDVIRDEALSGRSRANRSDVVRAAIMGLDKLSKEEVADLIERAKMK